MMKKGLTVVLLLLGLSCFACKSNDEKVSSVMESSVSVQSVSEDSVSLELTDSSTGIESSSSQTEYEDSAMEESSSVDVADTYTEFLFDPYHNNWGEEWLEIEGNATINYGEAYAELYFEEEASKVVLYSKQPYQGVVEVSFDFCAPVGAQVGAWGLAFLSSIEQAKPAVDTILADLSSYTEVGVWKTVRYDSLDGENWDIFIGDKGKALEYVTTAVADSNITESYLCFMGGSGEKGVIQIDNVEWSTRNEAYVEDFNGGTELFSLSSDNEKGSAAFVWSKKPSVMLGASATEEYCVNVDFEKFQTTSAHLYGLTMVTKTAYKNISEITFDAYLPAGIGELWWGLAPVASPIGAYGENTQDCLIGANETTFCNTVAVFDQWISFRYSISDQGLTWKLFYKTEGNAEWIDTQKSFTCTNSNGKYQNEDGYSYIQVLGATGDSRMNGIKLDRFTIVADGERYFEDFCAGASALFDLNPNENGEMPARTEKIAFPTVEERAEAGTLNTYLHTIEDCVKLNLPLDTDNAVDGVLYTATIDYKIAGDKGVAIVVGENSENGEIDFLYLSDESLSFYHGNEKINEISLDGSENVLQIAISAQGGLVIKLNDGEDIAMGIVLKPRMLALLNADGDGLMEITRISVLCPMV